MTAPTFGDRVQETFTTTGTGSISLAGAITGYQAFSAVMSNAGTCYYMATDGTNWEVGLGTYATSGNTLARTTVLSSSNAGAAVNWAAGTKSISLDFPATAAAAVAGGLTKDTSAITGGTSGYVLYDNAGTVGELATTGSGNVARATSPTFITPALGTPASGNLSNCTGIPAGTMTALGVGSIIFGRVTAAVTAGTPIAASNISPTNFTATNNTGTTGLSMNGASDTISGTWNPLQSVNPAGNFGWTWFQRTV